MNYATRRIKIRQLIEQMSALINWRCELTEDIFEAAMEENALRTRRNNVDRAINLVNTELGMMAQLQALEDAERLKNETLRTQQGTSNN